MAGAVENGNLLFAFGQFLLENFESGFVAVSDEDVVQSGSEAAGAFQVLQLLGQHPLHFDRPIGIENQREDVDVLSARSVSGGGFLLGLFLGLLLTEIFLAQEVGG